MAAHPDIELQLLEHLRVLREAIAVLHVKVEGLEQRLDVLQSGDRRAEALAKAES